MRDYDPFSAGSSFGNTSNYGYGKKKKKDYSKYIKKIIPYLMIALAIFLIVKYVFLYNTMVEVNIENTEGEYISNAEIIFTKSGDSRNKQTFNVDDDIKLRRGSYDYKIKADGYNLYSKSNVKLDDDKYHIDQVLEKNIKLNILGLTFPQTIFAGQDIISQINVENSSATQTYTAEKIEFDTPDDINYFFCDVDGYKKNSDNIIISKKQSKDILVCFKVSEDIDVGEEYSITPRIKYKKTDEDDKKEFIVKEKPNIDISFDNVDAEFTIGLQNKHNIIYEINNKSNDIDILDLKLDLNIESSENQDLNVEQWFRYEKNKISVDSGSKKQHTIEIIVPNKAQPEIITGNIIFSSKTLLEQPITKEFNIELKEPEIDYEIDLSSDHITLEWDVNSNTTEKDYLNIRISNKNNFDIEIKNIELINASPTKQDCNKFIFLSPSYIKTVQKDKPIDVSADLTGNLSSDYLQTIDPNLAEDLSRLCKIKVTIDHPFREDLVLESEETFELELDPIQ